MNADSAYRLRAILAALNDRNITLPDPVNVAVQRHQAVVSNTPAPQPLSALRDAIIDGAGPEELGGILLADLGSARLLAAHNEALTHTAHTALEQLLIHRDPVHAQLAQRANELIAKLHATAVIDVPINTLIREGRHEDAKLVADVDHSAAELNALFDLRDHHLVPGGFRTLTVGHINCARWRNAPDIDGYLRGGITDGFLSGLRAGGDLWYPTAEEAIAAAQTYWDDYVVVETERKKELFGTGSTVSWG